MFSVVLFISLLSLFLCRDLELGREFFTFASKYSDVGTDGYELAAEFEPLPGISLICSENSRRLARLADAANSFIDNRFYFGIRRLTRIAKRGVQVGRANEHAVDSLDAGDLLDIVDGALRLDLDEHAKFFVCPLRIILDAAEARRARGAAHTAQSVDRVAGVGNSVFRFLFVLDVGNEQGLCADVEI